MCITSLTDTSKSDAIFFASLSDSQPVDCFLLLKLKNNFLQTNKFEDNTVGYNLLSYDKNTSGKISQDVEDKLKWEKIETTPRDLVIFDSYVPHRSDKNTTNNSRRIFYFTRLFIHKSVRIPHYFQRICIFQICDIINVF